MKCPHCSYSHGWDREKMETIKGLKGDFFESPVKMEKHDLYYSQTAIIYGCPECGKLFIEV